MQRALSDVERAINSINNLPEEAKEPESKVIIPYEQIGLILITGEVSEFKLKLISKEVRQLLLDKGIDKVDIDGYRKQVIYVDADPIALLSNKLDISDLNKEILTNLKSIPSGVFRDDKLIQLRTAGTNDTINKIKKIIFNTPNPKEDLKIDELADIYETYKEGDSLGMTNGNPALTLRVFRS